MYSINFYNGKINELWKSYIDTRSKGLKKEANKLLNNLVEYINSLKYKEKEDFVNYICHLRFDQDIDIEMQYPLVKRVIFPILSLSIKNKQMPQIRWLYELGFIDTECDNKIYKNIDDRVGLLELAHQVDPDDLKTVKLLINSYLYALYFGSHHIPDFILIDKQEVNEIENHLISLFDRYNNTDIIEENMVQEFKYYVDLFIDWFYFHEYVNEGSFSKWCCNENKNYRWVKSYYYKK